MTPEQEQAVRRALAAAARAEDAERGSTAVPPDVVDRLDDVLADLVHERRTSRSAGSPGAHPPVQGAQGDELAARRRRRWPQVLVAAAAVAVIAAAGGAVVTRGLGTSGGGSSAGSASSPEDRTAAGGQAAPHQTGTPSSGAQVFAAGAAHLRSETLRHDVQSLVDAQASTDKAARVPAVPKAGCTSPAVSQGEQAFDVELDGRPATLVLGRRTDGKRAASVFSCQNSQVPVATTTVDAR